MPVKGGNLWAKLAGKYYEEHKNDDDINEFKDVLQSPKYKAYYNSEKARLNGSSTKKRGKSNKTKKNKFIEREFDNQIEEVIIEEPKKIKGKKIRKIIEEEPKKLKNKTIKSKKIPKFIEEEIIEIEQPIKEERKHQFKNEYFNGGK